MKYLASIFISLFLFTLTTKADSLWIEADATGHVGKAQTIKVIFGSYNQYRLQKVGDEFQEVKNFTCWAISPTGKRIALNFSPKDTSHEASFTPTEKGIYVVLLENKKRKVEDWRNSGTKIGITKQHYYGRTTIKVDDGETVAKDVLTDLSLVRYPENQLGLDATIQVLLHGKPVPNATLFLRHPEMKEQKFTTDAQGKVFVHAPKSGRYFALATLRFETPGTYNGVHYDVFREKATLILWL